MTTILDTMFNSTERCKKCVFPSKEQFVAEFGDEIKQDCTQLPTTDVVDQTQLQSK